MATSPTAGSSNFVYATQLTPTVSKEIDDAFTYHSWNDEQVKKGNAVREACATAVKALIENVPPCPTRTTAIRKLMEARMDANSAITHNGKY